MERTAGTLLGGRVRYSQFVGGYRTGIEPVLLAAAVPAMAGEVVLEAGCGAGAGLLCLLWRVPGVRGVGVEIDPEMAALARDNLEANAAAAEIVEGDVLAVVPGQVDHVMANPPWRDPGGTASPDAKRRVALQGHAADWVAPLAALVAPRGTLTLAAPARDCALAMEALRAAGLRRMVLFPLWPRQRTAARLVLLQARRGAESCGVLPGLVLHGQGSGYTAETDAVLRGGGALTLSA